MSDPSIRHFREIYLADCWRNLLQAFAIAREMNWRPDGGGCRSGERVNTCRMPVDRFQQAVMNNVGHPQPDAVSVARIAQSTHKNTLDAPLPRPRIRIAVDAAIYDLRIHARAANVLAD